METNDIVSYLRKFHDAGWMPGSVGAGAQLIVHNESSKKILVTPDNLDINTFTSSDLFVLRDLYGTQEIQAPLKGKFSISKWATVFFTLLAKTDAKCAAFVSTQNSCLIGRKAIQLWNEKSESHPNLLRLSHWGLIKDLGIPHPEVNVPIIDCFANEALPQVNSVFDLYVNPFPAILVRNYGLLVWENSLSLLRNKIEILERLFALQLNSDF
jgi:ribulose-5-phosphate 4-epimerase/fuculose-1-phosphate aldolase